MLTNQAQRRFSHLGFDKVCQNIISDIKAAGTYKNERIITSAQGMVIQA